MRLLAEGRPHRAVGLALVMVDDQFAVIEARLARNRAGPDPADVLHAAVLDQAAHHFEDPVDHRLGVRRRGGHLAEDIAEGGDVLGQAAQGLLGAEVKIEVAPFVQFARDLVKAVLLGGNDAPARGGAGRGRGRNGNLLFLATGEEGNGADEQGDGDQFQYAGFHGCSFSQIIAFPQQTLFRPKWPA